MVQTRQWYVGVQCGSMRIIPTGLNFSLTIDTYYYEDLWNFWHVYSISARKQLNICMHVLIVNLGVIGLWL